MRPSSLGRALQEPQNTVTSAVRMDRVTTGIGSTSSQSDRGIWVGVVSNKRAVFLKMGHFSGEWIFSVNKDLFSPTLSSLLKILLVILIENGLLMGSILNICIVLIYILIFC